MPTSEPVVYADPIAYVVTAIIVVNETGETVFTAHGALGRFERESDERDVIALFATESEAERYAKAKQEGK